MKIVSKSEFLDLLRDARGVDWERYDEAVRPIIRGVRTGGDKALVDFIAEFDGPDRVPKTLLVSAGEIAQARAGAGAGLVYAIESAAQRIRRFHERQVSTAIASYSYSDRLGSNMGMEMFPLDRVGVYVPGGLASYPSSVLMGVLPAKIAGVRQVIVCTPPGPGGSVPASLLIATNIAGVSAVYKVGGAQAIAAMAYGTETIPEVNKIVGPGNVFVTAAKRAVFGKVDIDSLAGPSEVAVLAGDRANPAYVASDLLAQAEHDPVAWPVLVTWSRGLIDAVREELRLQVTSIKRRAVALQSLSSRGYAVLVGDLAEAIDVINEFAPEHVEVVGLDGDGRSPRNEAAEHESLKALLRRLRNCGAAFFGDYSPVAAGDYGAGPNHVLPTGGSARSFSGLTVRDFVRSMTFLSMSREGLKAVSGSIIRLSEEEGLTAHAESVRVRLRQHGVEPEPISQASGPPEPGFPVLRSEISALQEYFPGTEGLAVRLDSNEMPYDLPSGIKEQIFWEIMRLPLNRYPQNLYGEVKRELGKYLSELWPEGDLTEDNLVLSDGLDEMIQIISSALGADRGRAIVPVPGFSQYKVGLTIAGSQILEVPLLDGFELDVQSITALANGNHDPNSRASVVFICNPNNPTGNLFRDDSIRKIAEETSSVMVIDEAYGEFAGKTMLPLISEYPSRVVVLKTLSKAFGLAGVRLGYAVTGKRMAQYINKARQPFNVGTLPLITAKVALKNRSFLRSNVEAVKSERRRLFGLLGQIPGVLAYPSSANFILFAVDRSQQVWNELRQRGIAVRRFGEVPRISGCLRVTVGTPREDDLFLEALSDILASRDQTAKVAGK